MYQYPYLDQNTLSYINQIINLHNYEEGIYLVKRKSVYTPLIEHYGIAVIGKYLKNFNPNWNRAKVIHKTNLGIHVDDFEPFGWEKVEKVTEANINQAVGRAGISLYDAYSLISDNCEHFARFVTTGKKESSQVQNAVVASLAIGGLYWLFKNDQ